MASSTISVRVQPLTGRKSAGQIAHDLRSPMPGNRVIPDYVNTEKTKENTILISPPTPSDLRAEIAANRKKSGQQALRTDARTMVAGVITFGRDAQLIVNALPVDEQNDLYARVARRIERETKHKLLSLVVHRDESAPHAHFMLRGYRMDYEGFEMPWRFKPDYMSLIQDIAGDEVNNLGITRGIKKSERIARGDNVSQIINRSVKQLHNDLPVEISELEKKRDYYIELIAKSQEKLQSDNAKSEAIKKRVEIYENRLASITGDIKNKLGAVADHAASDVKPSFAKPAAPAPAFGQSKGYTPRPSG